MRRTIAVLITISLAAVTFIPATSFAQTRKRTTTRSSRSGPKLKPAELQSAGATRVADQIKILTRFIYVLGGVAKGLEGVDDAARRNEAPSAVLDQSRRAKETVRTSIQNVREGLDKLELDFRTTPGLERYYARLAGVAAGAADAEDLAASNQFDKAGRRLLDVVNQLTDALLTMR